MTRAIFIDVDDTLIRSFGSKRIPMDATVRLVRSLHAAGGTLDCYANTSATEAGVETCFTAFLLKPDVPVDDVTPDAWGLRMAHPKELVK